MLLEDMILEKENGIAILTLNRPERLNAVSMAMREGFPQVAKEVSQDDEVKVLIVTGAGRGFCSGADVAAQQSRLLGEIQITRSTLLEPLAIWLLPLYRLNKPTIAAVNGIAAGIGLSTALMCDIVIASDQARFSAIWIRRALMPDGGATHLLPRIVGPAKALELMLTGDIIDAREAERIGMVNRVVPHDELMKEAKALATKFAKGPSIAMELTKRAVYKGLVNDIESQFDFESYGQNICYQTEDFKEGVNAFLEKREARFRGV